MPITAKCNSCSAQFKVKNELAGKKVKCPKCKQPFQIPALAKKPAQKQAQQRSQSSHQTTKQQTTPIDDYDLAPAVAVPKHNPMLDLLDQAGVESTPRGPTCSNCGSEMSSLAIICVECGYNNETGKQLETTSVKAEGGIIDEGMSDAEKMLAKAEQEIDETPMSATEQNFGDGADSFFLAIVCLVGAFILTSIGVGTIFIMDRIGENIDTALISMYGSIAIYIFCAVWITIVAFRAKPIHGVACILTGGLWCIVFGFMNGKALLMPTLICIFGILIGLLSYALGGSDDKRSQLLEAAVEFADIVTIV